MPIKAGLIGCGRIGSEFAEQNLPTHAGVYREVKGVELVALSDIDENKLEKAGKRWGVSNLYQDYKEMLGVEKLDILSIATRAPSHREILEEAVKHGVKAIYCEKPIADNLAKTDVMVKLCNKKKVILQINHQRRFDSLYQAIKSFLQAGKLGKLREAGFEYSRGIANTGSHVFDLLRFLLGDARNVTAVFSLHKSHDANDPNINGFIVFKTGVSCRITAAEDQNITAFSMEIIGEKGKLDILRNGAAVEYYERRAEDWQRAVSPFDVIGPRDSMRKAVERLIECLQEGKNSISSGEDGRAALELICAFHESAAGNGKEIRLPLKKSKVSIT